jgi:hypothetical protein
MRRANRNVCIAAAVAVVALIALIRLVPAAGKDTGLRDFLWVPTYVLFLAAAAYFGLNLETYLDSKRKYPRSNEVYDRAVMWAYAGVAVLALLIWRFMVPQERQFLGIIVCFGVLGFTGLCSAFLLWFRGTRGTALTMLVVAVPQCILFGGLLWIGISWRR